MRAYVLFLLTAGSLVLPSCSVPETKGPSKPDTLLCISEMQEMMTEICQLEATLRVYESEDPEKREDIGIYGKQQLDSLLQRHHITWKTWEANFNYYMTRNPLSDTLMAKVTERLSQKEALKNEALRKAVDTQQTELRIPKDAQWEDAILF